MSERREGGVSKQSLLARPSPNSPKKPMLLNTLTPLVPAPTPAATPRPAPPQALMQPAADPFLPSPRSCPAAPRRLPGKPREGSQVALNVERSSLNGKEMRSYMKITIGKYHLSNSVYGKKKIFFNFLTAFSEEFANAGWEGAAGTRHSQLHLGHPAPITIWVGWGSLPQSESPFLLTGFEAQAVLPSPPTGLELLCPATPLPGPGYSWARGKADGETEAQPRHMPSS